MRILIFKPGTWNGRRYTQEFCRQMVANYDPQRGIEAPVVVGHRDGWGRTDEYEFAHGWASSLEVDVSGQVFAIIPEPTGELVEWIQTHKLRYVSIEMFFDLSDKDIPINPQLVRIAVLGRSIPAVPVTRIKAEFSAVGGGLFVQEADGVYCAFGVLTVDGLDTESNGEEEAMGQTQGASADTATESVEELQAKLAASEARADTLEKRNTELEAKNHETEAATFMASVGGTGLPPAVRDQAAAHDVTLNEEQRKSFRAFLGALAPVVTLGKDPVVEQPQRVTGNLSEKIRAYQKKHNLGSFVDAMTALRSKQPELFAHVAESNPDDDDEGGDAA